MIMKKIEALINWCHDCNREGLQLDANEFRVDVLTEYVMKAQLDDAGDNTNPEPPKDFKVLKWVSWAKKWETYLWHIKGKDNVPLIYVVRRERDPNLPFASEEESRVHAVTLAGNALKIDSTRVWNELQTIMADAPAWTWISKFEARKDGRGAMEALRDHYDGPGEVEKRISYAKRELETAHYSSENVFTFEKYVTKLSEAFQSWTKMESPKQRGRKLTIYSRRCQSTTVR